MSGCIYEVLQGGKTLKQYKHLGPVNKQSILNSS